MDTRKEKEKVFIKNYGVYKDKIYTYFLYRVNFDQETAEDLTAEVFLKAFTHLDSFDDSRSFQAWIYAISRNHLFNHYRSSSRTVRLDETNDIAVEFSQQFEACLDLETAIKAIYELDEYCREVLLLRFVDGLDNQEIAAALNKDEGAVRTQISRALAELRSKIN
ncbi:MAG: RNA polymerase sigma factor [Candidatus Falkowbacteria bacterium]|nr:RNA polymerase sigma factor [Candidatus Falkowbacteria bacterium]